VPVSSRTSQDPENYESLLTRELSGAPEEFKTLYSELSSGDHREVSQLATRAAGILHRSHPEWAAASLCVRAWCSALATQYRAAVEDAHAANLLGLNHLARSYYYIVLPTALDQLDELENALSVTREAVGYFAERNALPQAANALNFKASVLKQLASPLSMAPQKRQQARQYVAEAIEALRDAVMLEPSLSEQLTETLGVIRRIAARAGLHSVDFAKGAPAWLAEAFSQYFSSEALREEAIVQPSLPVDALTPLIPRPGDGPKGPRDFLNATLGFCGSPTHLRELLALDRDFVVRRLITLLQTGETYERKSAAFALGQIGERRFAQYLEEAWGRESMPGLRSAIGASLATVRTLPSEAGSAEIDRREMIERIYREG
jgi:hypothetical protein